jgi:hypothetical protein
MNDDLRNKDKTIIAIWTVMLEVFGATFFKVTDFWNADNCALGFQKGEKLIYVSTWKFKDYSDSGIKCYTEFELIDEVTFETKQSIKKIECIAIDDFINEVKTFVGKPGDQ